MTSIVRRNSLLETPPVVATTSYTKSDGTSGHDGMGWLVAMRQIFGSTSTHTWTYDTASRITYTTSPDGKVDPSPRRAPYQRSRERASRAGAKAIRLGQTGPPG